MYVYVVIGYEKQDNDSFDKEIYGVMSTEELANEMITDLQNELDFIDHFEIEKVMLDEFGYR